MAETWITFIVCDQMFLLILVAMYNLIKWVIHVVGTDNILDFFDFQFFFSCGIMKKLSTAYVMQSS